MKNLKPYRHSALDFRSRTFSRRRSTRRSSRKTRSASARPTRTHGYFTAKALDETVQIIPKGGRGWRLPLFKTNSQGIAADITIPVEEGRLYHLRNANFVGVKLFRDARSVLMPLFGMRKATSSRPTSCARASRTCASCTASSASSTSSRSRTSTSVPNTRPDRSHHDRRRRQAVLHPAHRFLGQHHHARQGHPARNAARRRRHVQYPALGLQHSAPEPARAISKC